MHNPYNKGYWIVCHVVTPQIAGALGREPWEALFGARYKPVKDRVFMTESKHTLPLEIVYKDIGHSAVDLTKDDMQCQGSTMILGNEIHYGVIQYDTTTVLVKEISVEMGEDKAVNLDNNQELPSSCQAGGAFTDGLDS